MLRQCRSLPLFRRICSRHFSEVAAGPQKMTVRDALNSALFEEFERDESVMLMGEEVAEYQGAYKISKGLLQKFGSKRVVDTPITEMGFSGMGIGMALNGCKPVIEFMSWNFSMQAIDQIVNSAAKLCYMSGGKINVPIVFRGTNGAAMGVGAQHSQDFGAWYSSVPGLKVLAVYDSEDARGLLKAAIRDPDPCIVFENELLYGTEFEVSEAALDKDFVAPIGKVRVMKEGTDMTIISHGSVVGKAVEAAQIAKEKYGINCEVINLRTLRPLDREGILASVKKTHRLVTVEEGWPQCGIGAEIAALVMESDAFDQLDAPVQRVCSTDVPMPYCVNLEKMVLPQTKDVMAAIERIM